MMSIIIGADVVPSANNSHFFEEGDIDSLLGDELKKKLDDADFRVFNLETPLTDSLDPIDKCGRSLHADCSTVLGLKKLGVDLFNLANNHIMDQGENGLKSTTALLDKYKIRYFGGGDNLIEAQRPFIAFIDGKKIGFYACSEHEFSIAKDNSPGANPFNPLESFDHVAELSNSCDYLIVLYHGGKEHYQYPSPMLQRVCHKFVKKGANLVICQHSHCIGCEEKYEKGTIVYGQGNFLFESNHGPFSNTSILIRLNDDFSIDYLPLVKVEKGVRLAKEKEAEDILLAFKKRSLQITDDGFIKKEYKRFAKIMLNEYMFACLGYKHKPILRVMNRLCGGCLAKLLVHSYKKEELLAIRNYIECEAHRELWLEGLKNVKA